MNCQSTAWQVEKAIRAVEGVKDVVTNLVTQQAFVIAREHDAHKLVAAIGVCCLLSVTGSYGLRRNLAFQQPSIHRQTNFSSKFGVRGCLASHQSFLPQILSLGRTGVLPPRPASRARGASLSRLGERRPDPTAASECSSVLFHRYEPEAPPSSSRSFLVRRSGGAERRGGAVCSLWHARALCILAWLRSLMPCARGIRTSAECPEVRPPRERCAPVRLSRGCCAGR